MLTTKEEFEKSAKELWGWSIWQTKEWWEYQASTWKKVFSIWANSWASLVIKWPLPFWQNYLYVQRWPIWLYDEIFFEDLKDIAREEWSTFIRVSSEKNIHYHWNFFNSIKDYFPKASLVINLEKSEEEILKQMKQKGRYNIRLAQKKWVKIEEEKDSEKASEIFEKLVKETTQRDWFWWHKKEVYKKMIDSLWDKIKVLIAYFEWKEIAAWIFTLYEDQAVYYYWASSNKHRNLMAPYLIQWNAMQIAKEMWCKTYDFFWIAKDEKNKKDSWYWVTQFKLKFWGRKKEYPKAFDIPMSLWKYLIYRVLKFIR